MKEKMNIPVFWLKKKKVLSVIIAMSGSERHRNIRINYIVVWKYLMWKGSSAGSGFSHSLSSFIFQVLKIQEIF